MRPNDDESFGNSPAGVSAVPFLGVSFIDQSGKYIQFCVLKLHFYKGNYLGVINNGSDFFKLAANMVLSKIHHQ